MTTEEIKNKLKISENTCIHCPTLELVKQVLIIFNQLGLRWSSEKHYITYSHWDNYRENTVYYPFKGLFSSLGLTYLTGYKVISAEEFIALHTEKKEFDLENYTPKGDLIGFPKEIIARMLDCQEEQGNLRDVSIFESSKSTDLEPGGFDWHRTKEKGSFWYKVIDDKNFDIFFEKYPKQDNQESKTAKYVQVGNNTILSDITSTQSSVEINTTEEDSQGFRVGDEVIDIMTGKIGFITEINQCPVYELIVTIKHGFTTGYLFDGKYNDTDKNPRLLHYRNDYNYDVIDFNNLPKRQNSKRWRANRHSGYWIIDNFFEVYEFEENNTDTDDTYNNLGNYFQTKEEAQEVANKLNEYFQELINPNK